MRKKSKTAKKTTEEQPKKKRKRLLPKVLSREDAARLLNTPDVSTLCGMRDKVAMLLMYRAGLRVSEVCSLMVEDVDVKHGFIFVQRGKGEKDRVVPMDPELVEWCKKWLEMRPASDYFVCTQNGTPVLDRYLRVVVARYAKQAGVYIRDGEKKKLPHPHTLRHCFGTELIEDGFSLPEVMELMGHADIGTTAIYTHVRPEHLARKIRERVVS